MVSHHWHLPATKRVISSMLSSLPCKTQPSSLVMATTMESVASCSTLSIYIWKCLERTRVSPVAPGTEDLACSALQGHGCTQRQFTPTFCSPKVTTELESRETEPECSVEQSLFLSAMKRNMHIYYKICKCFRNE